MIRTKNTVVVFACMVILAILVTVSASALTELNDVCGTAATVEESSTTFYVDSERPGSTITLTQSMGTMHWKTYTDEFVVTGYEKDTSAYADLIVNYRKSGSDHWEITSYSMDFHPFRGDHWIDRDYTITFPESGEYEVRVASKPNQAERKYVEEGTADLLAAWLPDHWIGDPPSWNVSHTEGCTCRATSEEAAAVSAAAEAGSVGIKGSVNALTDEPSDNGIHVCSQYTVNSEIFYGPIFSYDLLDDGTARILEYYGYVQDVCIPESVDGYSVSTIGRHAIPDTPVGGSIGICIPGCISVIEPDAFDNIYAPIRFSLNEANSAFQLVDDILICPSENRIIRGYGRGEYRIPDGIETLDSHAFYGSNFTSIYIPASVKTLGQNPFAGCNTSADTHASLRAVELSPDNDTLEIRDEILFSKADHRLIWAFVIDPRININYIIPDDVVEIDDFAFWRCRLTESVTIPTSVKKIGISPFRSGKYCIDLMLNKGNENFLLENGMLICPADHRLIYVLDSSTEPTLTVPEGIEIIGDYAFYGHTTISDQVVILPDSVSIIGSHAFTCSSCSVRLPATVRRIGSHAFRSCQALKELPVFEDGVQFDSGAFAECQYIEKLTVNGGAVIGYAAFGVCTRLKEVLIGNGASRILPNAFSSSLNLETVQLGEGLTFIGSGAFRQCEAFRTISLPSSLSYIGESALSNHTDQEFNQVYGVMTIVFSSTVHATVTKGTYAEQYCESHNVPYSFR